MVLTQETIDKAIAQVKTSFTVYVMPNCMYVNNPNHFNVSVVNIRQGWQYLVDYTFHKETAKLIRSKTIERTPAKA